MNEHISNDWERPRRHRPGGARSRARQRFAEREGFGGFGPREGEGGFGADAGMRGRPGSRGGSAPFGPWGRGYGRHGGRAKRGDVRAAALALLAEEPMNGYQMIQQISERSGGLWRPSPGSVYPALAQLEDEGLITAQASDTQRRALALTEAGRAYAADHADELREPWSAMTGGAATAAADMRMLLRQIHLAAFGVVTAGTDAQLGQARTVLTQARRALYRILADDDQAGPQLEAAESDHASGPC